MTGPVSYLQKGCTRSTVNECVNTGGQTRKNSTCLPGFHGQIPLTPTAKTTRYALGAGDRQFESGHPEFNLFLYNGLQEGVFLCCRGKRLL